MEYVTSGIREAFFASPSKKRASWNSGMRRFRLGHKGAAAWATGIVRRRCWWRSFDGWPWDAGCARHARVMAYIAEERRRVMRGLSPRRARRP